VCGGEVSKLQQDAEKQKSSSRCAESRRENCASGWVSRLAGLTLTVMAIERLFQHPAKTKAEAARKAAFRILRQMPPLELTLNFG
jgi:hypothetical protein